MAGSKRTYMQVHDPLADRYWNHIKQMIEEEQMFYETLCDNRLKDNNVKG